MIEPCEAYRQRLEALVDGELPDDQARPLGRHIAECERCAAYRAELAELCGSLGRVTLARDAPDVAGTVMRRLRRRRAGRFALAAAWVVLLKLLDVVGLFGSGALPRVIVTVGVLPVFALLGINPLRIVRSEELLKPHQTGKGAANALA